MPNSIALVALVAFAGCSLTIQGPPRTVRPGQPVSCDSGAPVRGIADLVGGLGFLAAAGMANLIVDQVDESDEDYEDHARWPQYSLLAASAVYFTALVVGRWKISKCRSARRAAGLDRAPADPSTP